MTRTEQLAEARQMVATYRAQYDAAKVGSKAWHAAADELDWWIGKATALALDPARMAPR